MRKCDVECSRVRKKFEKKFLRKLKIENRKSGHPAATGTPSKDSSKNRGKFRKSMATRRR
jgi:hypothetical protein